MTTKRLNPNHPVTQQLDDGFMHKVAAILVMKAGGRAEITSDDIRQLEALFGGDEPTLVTKSGDTLEFWLLPRSEAMELAREAGGLPQ